MSKTFTVKNYKGISEVTLTSGRGLVILAGDNKQGKSSFLDGIREVARFAGSRETPEPIRQGQDEATVEIIDHERERRYVRTFKRSKSGKVTYEVSVYALDGAKYSNPAEILAQDVGAEIIDAGEFARMSAKDQRDTLLRQITLPFDLDEIAREKKGAEERRLEAGREVKRLQSVLDSLPKADTALVEEVSSASILAELEAAQTRNLELQRAAELATQLSGRVAAMWQREEELKDQIRSLREERDKVELQRADAESDSQVDPVDVVAIQDRLRGLDAVNQAVRANKERAKVAADLASVTDLHAGTQEALDKIDEKKRAGLAEATFPDPQLSFDDTGVLYAGVPFQQLNDADKRIVGAQILVGASDRALRIGFLREGDLLDDANLERLSQVAVDSDYTFLVERGRDSSKDLGYRFTDGVLADEAVA